MSQTEWPDEMMDMVKRTGSINLKELAIKRFGEGNERNMKMMYNIFYWNRKKFSDDMGMKWKKDGDFIKFTPIGSEIKEKNESPEEEVHTRQTRTKTMVVVVEQKNDECTVKILGDANRAMMKEVMKQMMEAVI